MLHAILVHPGHRVARTDSLVGGSEGQSLHHSGEIRSARGRPSRREKTDRKNQRLPSQVLVHAESSMLAEKKPCPGHAREACHRPRSRSATDFQPTWVRGFVGKKV